jgi:hypothetical protein
MCHFFRFTGLGDLGGLVIGASAAASVVASMAYIDAYHRYE